MKINHLNLLKSLGYSLLASLFIIFGIALVVVTVAGIGYSVMLIHQLLPLFVTWIAQNIITVAVTLFLLATAIFVIQDKNTWLE